jgi:hypothetical protein
VDSGTPSAVLSLFWDKAGASAIQAVTGDKELARKIFQETKDTNKTPSQILREADMERKSKTVLGALPKFKDLGKIGSFADGIARTYKTQGKQEALREIDRHPKSETKLKSVSCGLLMAMNALKGKEWQFTKEELDYGRYLADFACALLDADPNKYRDAESLDRERIGGAVEVTTGCAEAGLTCLINYDLFVNVYKPRPFAILLP